MNLFSLLIGIGGSLGLMQVARNAPPRKEVRWAAAGLALLAAALAGARANYVLLHPYQFSGGWLQAARFWEGGLSWPGGLAAALLMLFLCALVLRARLGVAADRLAPLFMPVAVMAWLGCGTAGCAYGSPLNQQLPWALPVLDYQGVETYRWPLAYLAAAALLLFAWRAERLSENAQAPGARACITGIALALHSLLFSYLRADPLPAYQGVRLDYAAALGLGGLCLLGLVGLGIARLRASFSDEAPGANRESWFSPRE